GEGGAASGGEAEERSDPGGVGGGLAVGERPGALAAAQDQSLATGDTTLDEAVVIPPRIAQILIPGEALGLHEIRGLVPDQPRPAPPVEGQGSSQGCCQEQTQHGPTRESLHGGDYTDG